MPLKVPQPPSISSSLGSPLRPSTPPALKQVCLSDLLNQLPGGGFHTRQWSMGSGGVLISQMISPGFVSPNGIQGTSLELICLPPSLVRSCFQLPSNGCIPSPSLIFDLDLSQLLLPPPFMDSAPPQFLPSPGSPAPAPAPSSPPRPHRVPASSNLLAPPCKWFQRWLLFKRAASGSHVN